MRTTRAGCTWARTSPCLHLSQLGSTEDLPQGRTDKMGSLSAQPPIKGYGIYPNKRGRPPAFHVSSNFEAQRLYSCNCGWEFEVSLLHPIPTRGVEVLLQPEQAKDTGPWQPLLRHTVTTEVPCQDSKPTEQDSISFTQYPTWWPTKGEAVHKIKKAQGSPYRNWQYSKQSVGNFRCKVLLKTMEDLV